MALNHFRSRKDRYRILDLKALGSIDEMQPTLCNTIGKQWRKVPYRNDRESVALRAPPMDPDILEDVRHFWAHAGKSVKIQHHPYSAF